MKLSIAHLLLALTYLTPAMAATKPNYGLDAPAVVRNLLLAGSAGLILAAGIGLGLIPPAIEWSGGDGAHNAINLLGFGLGPGIACTFTGLSMIWQSRVGKVQQRERHLSKLRWRGNEQVVDVGCGRGLMLIGAAKRLTTGHATGIDIWRSEDLAGNDPGATLENARIEGVSDCVEVKTADMRELPFEANTIDVVVSCAAIHNLDAAVDRVKAISEIARVLKPGAHALIDDIRHYDEYRHAFAANGCALKARLDNRVISALWTAISFGSLRPGVMLVQKQSESRQVS
ncbi:MAG: class I SAM-dependent methyltransferase [Gemmatimonadaceae bacterium]